MRVIGHGFADAGALPVPTPLLMAVCTGVVLAAAAIPPRTSTTMPELASNLRGTAAVAARVLVVAMLAAIVVPAAFQEIVAESILPTLGLALQALLLVAGHALAMVVASDLAARHLSPRAASAALFPVRAAIVASLVLGVFLRFGLAR